MQERLKRRVGGKGGEDEEGGIIDRLNRLWIILSRVADPDPYLSGSRSRSRRAKMTHKS
jgi:hypothetical protein